MQCIRENSNRYLWYWLSLSLYFQSLKNGFRIVTFFSYSKWVDVCDYNRTYSNKRWYSSRLKAEKKSSSEKLKAKLHHPSVVIFLNLSKSPAFDKWLSWCWGMAKHFLFSEGKKIVREKYAKGKKKKLLFEEKYVDCQDV